MARRGRKRNLEKERLYWDLLASGLGTVEACRQVGIGRRTGLRWRRENGGVRPRRRVEEPAPLATRRRYLSLFEPERIQTLASQGAGVREIARRLGRRPSTISRKLRRTGDGDACEAGAANQHAVRLARRHRGSKLAADVWLHDFVQDKLEQEWSPSRSAATWPRIIPSTRSARRPSTRASTCPTAGPCGGIWPRGCVPDEPCVRPIAAQRSGRRASSTRVVSSTTALQRPTIVRSRGTGKVI